MDEGPALTFFAQNSMTDFEKNLTFSGQKLTIYWFSFVSITTIPVLISGEKLAKTSFSPPLRLRRVFCQEGYHLAEEVVYKEIAQWKRAIEKGENDRCASYQQGKTGR